MSSSEEFEECFFKCGRTEKTFKCSLERIKSIVLASKSRYDKIHHSLEERFSVNSVLDLYCHRNCISTYTSKTHINRALLKRSISDGSSYKESKRDLRTVQGFQIKKKRVLCSEDFNFKRDCFFCGRECVELDPKTPNRLDRFYLVRTVGFKTRLLESCKQRQDKWAEEVQLRVFGALSDLYAAGARYHVKCNKLFNNHRNMKAAKNCTNSNTATKEDDFAFNSLKQEMLRNSSQTWNSVQLFDLYSKFGVASLSRYELLEKLQNYFGEELLVLSSPGIASLVLFRKQFLSSALISTGNDDDFVSRNLKSLASVIRNETPKAEKSEYQLNIDISSVEKECSPTLLRLLNELKIPQLAALAIGSIVSSSLKKAPVQLQVAFANLLKKKSLIDELSNFKIATTYDEYKRFRASVATASSENYLLIGIKGGKGLVQVVGDNFDATICSENGLLQTHSMGMILTKYEQEKSTEMKNTTIARVNKNEVTLSPEPDVEIRRYMGPKKVPMSEVLQHSEEIPALRILALEAAKKVSLMKAQTKDYEFLKEIIHVPSTPEYSGFNTKLNRQSRNNLRNATQVMYLPLIDLPPNDHDTVLTSMLEAQRLTNECGQSFVVFTADQAIYKVVVDIIWNAPEKFSNFVPRLGGMHTLMSFIGCVGSLMAGSGIVQILECAFSGVLKMLNGKKFPQNMRALRLLVEEVLRPVFEEDNITNFDDMIDELAKRSTQSRTTRLWFYNLIKPTLIMMTYVRAEREGDWCLHLWCVEKMLPYFAAAGHWNYLRYASVYLMFMDRMPRDCMDHFLRGEHVMRHKSGFWNGIWSDMMIESTFMRYGHGERGASLTGLTLNSAGVKRWALSMHVTSQLVTSLSGMREQKRTDTTNLHKEEGNKRIIRDDEDRKNLKEKLGLCIQPLNPLEHPEGLVNIVTGKVDTSKLVNVDRAHEIGEIAVEKFHKSLPSGFHVSLKKIVVGMNENRKDSKLHETIQIDSSLLYSRILALQGIRDIKLDEVLKFELSSVPPSMFRENGSMRDSIGKSALMNEIGVFQSQKLIDSPKLIIIDGCALLWSVRWPAVGLVSDLVENFNNKILEKLQTANVNLVFDRYIDFSIKSATRGSRGKNVARKFLISEATPLPPQNAMLSNNDNKIQLINIICNSIVSEVSEKQYKNRLIVTGQDKVPVQIQEGVIIKRFDLECEFEEADVIMINQLVSEGSGIDTVHVLCDDTDVFVLLCFYYDDLNMKNKIYMVSLKPQRGCVDIPATVLKNKRIIPSLPAAHALSGCDTVAPLHSIGKKKVIKCLRSGKTLKKLGHLETEMDDILLECTSFIPSCYGVENGTDMTEVRTTIWAKRIGHAQLRAPSFSSLPPTKECFAENVKRAHYQTLLWLSINNQMQTLPDPTSLGWKKDEMNKTLEPISIPSGIKIAPDYILDLTRCACRSKSPCTSMRCSCRASNLSCGIMCQCSHEREKCGNPHTHLSETMNASEDEDN